MKLEEIAHKLQCELRGAGDVEITGVAGIEEAGESDLTFVSNPKYLSKISTTSAGAILISADAAVPQIPCLISDNPYLDFARAIEFFYRPPRPIPGIHPTAAISDGAQIGEDYSIGPNVAIFEGVRIGARCVLHANATIYPYAEIGDDFVAHSNATVREYSKIGDRVTLQNGAVIGGDGFGFAPDSQGRYRKMVQSGIAVLEDDVEVGANACIDRATVGETRVEKGAKIDNLVQIGHGSRIGRDTVLAAQTGLAGSTKVGKRVRMAGQVGSAGHLTIGDDVVATARTGIARSVEAGRVISGAPEMDALLWRRVYLLQKTLPELFRTVKRLEKELAEFKKTARDED